MTIEEYIGLFTTIQDYIQYYTGCIKKNELCFLHISAPKATEMGFIWEDTRDPSDNFACWTLSDEYIGLYRNI